MKSSALLLLKDAWRKSIDMFYHSIKFESISKLVSCTVTFLFTGFPGWPLEAGKRRDWPLGPGAGLSHWLPASCRRILASRFSSSRDRGPPSSASTVVADSSPVETCNSGLLSARPIETCSSGLLSARLIESCGSRPVAAGVPVWHQLFWSPTSWASSSCRFCWYRSCERGASQWIYRKTWPYRNYLTKP
jgi:hypothetical protein